MNAQNSGHQWLGSQAIGLASLALAAGMTLATSSAASAQAAYGSYIGIGGSVGVSGGSNGGSQAGGVVAARYRFLEVPLSLRAQALISDNTAFVPTISYDIPLNWQTDAYIGAGVALQTGGSDSSSPIGNQTAFVIQPGVDYSFPYSNLVLFGNAIIAFDAYRDENRTGASVQGGLGVRF
jgi:hypothetical protein